MTAPHPLRLDPGELDDLNEHARRVRVSIVTMLAAAKSGHSAGPLGLADIFAALYFNLLRHRPEQPDWPDRDIMLLSNGHTAPVLYAAMAHSGYFPLEELGTLRRLGSRLQGHPERHALPGLENTSGPLGSGLSQGAGYAHVFQHLDHRSDRWVYVVMGDGELNEGNVWEAAMYASKYRLSQLIGIVDRNFIQIDGDTEDVMPLGDLAGKWSTFGWHVLEVDGHDIAALVDAVNVAKAEASRPSVIIANTVPGKGVPFMEGDYTWHGKVPNADQAADAVRALTAVGAAR
ncbi:transketolase [Frankia sp. Cas3]|uniref:transketolase n=1 Tax=Frankia sp. Cas3 TaxID=3073926 RepID=UPI002AD4BFD4|nr:transketolase [Frankia sp. Cas3]